MFAFEPESQFTIELQHSNERREPKVIARSEINYSHIYEFERKSKE